MKTGELLKKGRLTQKRQILRGRWIVVAGDSNYIFGARNMKKGRHAWIREETSGMEGKRGFSVR